MRKATKEKVMRFLNDWDDSRMYPSCWLRNSTVLNTEFYPCYATLKRYGIVEYDHTEWAEDIDEGYCIELRYYRINKNAV